jgi:hypothetical protein
VSPYNTVCAILQHLDITATTVGTNDTNRKVAGLVPDEVTAL